MMMALKDKRLQDNSILHAVKDYIEIYGSNIMAGWLTDAGEGISNDRCTWYIDIVDIARHKCSSITIDYQIPAPYLLK